MGVMECDRAGCDQIMCKRYSYDYGYICSYCFQELKDDETNIYIFMKLKKQETHTFDKEEWVELLEKEFMDRSG